MSVYMGSLEQQGAKAADRCRSLRRGGDAGGQCGCDHDDNVGVTHSGNESP